MAFSSFCFEVHGRVQGVFFRAHTVEFARSLGLVGWVANSRRGTVVGEIQGPRHACLDMRHWLRNVGSPSSSIDRLDVTNEREGLATLDYTTMERRPNVD